MTKTQCETCNGTGELESGEFCQSCCDHEFDSSEGFQCLQCGKDGSEDVFCQAYDRWKDSRYDD